MTEAVVKSSRNALAKTGIVGGIGSLAHFLIPGGWPAVWEWIASIIRFAFEWLTSTTAVPNWLVILFSLCTLATFGVPLVIWILARLAKDIIDFPKEQSVFGILWRWPESRCGGFENLRSFCPNCDFQIYPRNTSGYRAIDRIIYSCEYCNWQSQEFDGTSEEIEDRVRRTLQRDLREELRRIEGKVMGNHK